MAPWVLWAIGNEGKSFCSAAFLAFFAAVFAVYWLLPWRQARVYWLLAASFTFYAGWSLQLALLITGTTSLDYLLARAIDAGRAGRLRKLLLILSISVNLVLLAYFKYANFFLDSLAGLLKASGHSTWFAPLQVIVPFGISFYTFEAISYTVDVYRRRVPAERNLANLLVFILFFPHLIAGPIVRARDFLPQVRRPKRWHWSRMQLGVQYFVLGLLKKVILADPLGQHYVDPVFARPTDFGTAAVWVAVVAYALQIYADFSGYSDMAIGAAHLLGYKLSRNFNLPYLSTNVSEFWHRWHMSLSSWLRDYLFIPLGGSRCSKARTGLNLMITMVLGGLWHGASWMFVGWGAWHGALLVAHRQWKEFCKPRPRLDRALQSTPGTAARLLTTFVCVLLGWILFRAGTARCAGDILKRLVVHRHVTMPQPSLRGFWQLLAVAVICHVAAGGGWWKRWAPRLPAPVWGFGYALGLVAVLVTAPQVERVFIYFQF